MGRDPWEKMNYAHQTVVVFLTITFHHFTCCLSWVFSYVSHHILAEIIFNWFSLPYVNLLRNFVCLLFLSTDKTGTLNYFGEEDDEGYDINGEACVE